MVLILKHFLENKNKFKYAALVADLISSYFDEAAKSQTTIYRKTMLLFLSRYGIIVIKADIYNDSRLSAMKESALVV